jgi:exopolysaccharide biosynthesis predicted pyruvyltransferase EpsI
MLETPLPSVIDALTPVGLVVSDRLHGALISAMMHKRTVLLPVDNHKSMSFYETWLHSVPGIAFASTRAEVTNVCPRDDTLVWPDFEELFRRYADPAFESLVARMG